MSIIPTVAVSVILHEQDGSPIQGAEIEAKLETLEKYQGFVVPDFVEGVATDATGMAVLNLFPNELGSESSEYRFKISHPSGRTDTIYAVVPNFDCELHNITELDHFEYRSVGAVITKQVADDLLEIQEVKEVVNEAATLAITSRDACLKVKEDVLATKASITTSNVEIKGWKLETEEARDVSQANVNEVLGIKEAVEIARGMAEKAAGLAAKAAKRSGAESSSSSTAKLAAEAAQLAARTAQIAAEAAAKQTALDQASIAGDKDIITDAKEVAIASKAAASLAKEAAEAAKMSAKEALIDVEQSRATVLQIKEEVQGVKQFIDTAREPLLTAKEETKQSALEALAAKGIVLEKAVVIQEQVDNVNAKSTSINEQVEIAKFQAARATAEANKAKEYAENVPVIVSNSAPANPASGTLWFKPE